MGGERSARGSVRNFGGSSAILRQPGNKLGEVRILSRQHLFGVSLEPGGAVNLPGAWPKSPGKAVSSLETGAGDAERGASGGIFGEYPLSSGGLNGY